MKNTLIASLAACTAVLLVAYACNRGTVSRMETESKISRQWMSEVERRAEQQQNQIGDLQKRCEFIEKLQESFRNQENEKTFKRQHGK